MGIWVTASVICDVGRVVGISVGTDVNVAGGCVVAVGRGVVMRVVPAEGTIGTAGDGDAGGVVCREPGVPVAGTRVCVSDCVPAGATAPDPPGSPERFIDGVTGATGWRRRTRATQAAAAMTSTDTARRRSELAGC